MNKLPYEDEQELDQDTLDLISGNTLEETVEDFDQQDRDDRNPAAMKYFTNDQSALQPTPKVDLSGQLVGRDSFERLDELVPKQEQAQSQELSLDTTSANPQLSNYENILKQLQDKRKDNNMVVNMARAGNQIAQAIASGSGAKIGDGSENLNAIERSNNQSVSDYHEQIKNQMDDPSSAISKYYRLQTLKTMKEQNPKMDLSQFDSMSANQLKDIVTQKSKSGSAGRIFDKNLVNPVSGKVETSLFNEKGDLVKNLGEAGYSYASGIDPTSGLLYNRSKSDPTKAPILVSAPDSVNVGKPLETKSIDGTTNKVDQTPYQIKNSLNAKERDILDKEVNQFQTDIKDEKRIISEIGAISDSSLELAKKNPNAAKTLGAQIAKIMQGSRLTDTDVILYTGQSGVMNQMQDFTSEALTGRITDEKAKNIKQVLETYNKALRGALDNRARQAAEITKQNFNPNLNIDTNVMSKLYYIDDKKINNSNSKSTEVRKQMPDGKIAIFNEATKKFIRYEK